MRCGFETIGEFLNRRSRDFFRYVDDQRERLEPALFPDRLERPDSRLPNIDSMRREIRRRSEAGEQRRKNRSVWFGPALAYFLLEGTRPPAPEDPLPAEEIRNRLAAIFELL